MSINIFFYYNHKLVDALALYHDATYIYKLLEITIDEIGPKYIIRLMIDKCINFKRVGKLIHHNYPHILDTIYNI